MILQPACCVHLSKPMYLDAPIIAKRAGLHYSIPRDRVIRRVRRGQAFLYVSPSGQPVRDSRTLQRIRKLAIPPAYDEVVISPDPEAHLQAVGVDSRGRKQYRYHPRWWEAQGKFKYQHILDFARALPKIRRITRRTIRQPGLSREKVLATVVQLLDKTWIRIGNDEYARQNGSYGLSTFRNQHVQVRRDEIVFKFTGKHKIRHEIILRDPRLAGVIRECHRTPGQDLFQYLGEDGQYHRVHSDDVNAYLHQISGREFTAKDFRTWGATIYAAKVLGELDCPSSQAAHRRALNEAIDRVAAKLGNTRAVCRRSYIHPEILAAFTLSANGLRTRARDRERWVIQFLKSRCVSRARTG